MVVAHAASGCCMEITVFTLAPQVKYLGYITCVMVHFSSNTIGFECLWDSSNLARLVFVVSTVVSTCFNYFVIYNILYIDVCANTNC